LDGFAVTDDESGAREALDDASSPYRHEARNAPTSYGKNAMALNVATLSVHQLDNLINNRRTHGATDAPNYLLALQEREVCRGKGLDFNKSFKIIRSSAKDRRLLCYKELADASRAKWDQVHYFIPGHLWNLLEFAHRRGWPLLTSIVVNKQDGPDTLKGFIKAARDLGYRVTDDEGFLREQQARVFEWATDASGVEFTA
jgi:hypothetical protein